MRHLVTGRESAELRRPGSDAVRLTVVRVSLITDTLRAISGTAASATYRSVDNDQSNVATSGISLWQVHPTPRFYSPGGSIGLTVWLQFANASFLVGNSTLKSPLRLGVRDPHLTQCVTGPHKCKCQVASKSVERFKRGARM